MSNIQKVKYVKEDQSESTRDVIIRRTPARNVHAFDVSSLDDADAEKLLSIVNDYDEYVEMKKKQILSLEDWMDHSQIDFDTDKIQHRQFKLDGLTIIE